MTMHHCSVKAALEWLQRVRPVVHPCTHYQFALLQLQACAQAGAQSCSWAGRQAGALELPPRAALTHTAPHGMPHTARVNAHAHTLQGSLAKLSSVSCSDEALQLLTTVKESDGGGLLKETALPKGRQSPGGSALPSPKAACSVQ